MIPLTVFAFAGLLAILLTAVALRRTRTSAVAHTTSYWVDTITEALAEAVPADDDDAQGPDSTSASSRSDSAAWGTAKR